MAVTKSFVFLDLETSGLPRNEVNSTKITEISLVAVTRDHILDKHISVATNTTCSSDFLPRVLNKMTLTIYPCKMIHPMASVVSGLTNENLELQKPFDESIYKLIVNFMERLEKPICLIAHNGSKFDFPILQAEFSNINKALSDDMFCADSLLGFREVLNDKVDTDGCNNLQSGTVFSDIKPLGSNIKSSSIPKCGLSNEEYNNEMIQAAELAERLAHQNLFNAREVEIQIQVEMERWRKLNESTPVRKHKNQNSTEPKKEISARRQLLSEKQLPKPKYNLKSLYKNLTKKELVDAHQAEADALALLQCVTAVGLPILEWFDNNRIPFRSIKKLW